MVEFENVSVTYENGVDALNNVSLKIKDGEFAFVVGASGAGFCGCGTAARTASAFFRTAFVSWEKSVNFFNMPILY